jgi:RNA polymerase sigma-70 factor (ECF subfamily)
MDDRQFEIMVRAFSSDLYRFAFWLCRNRWQAQDLVQECFASAWKARETLRDDSAIKAWLFSILRNAHAATYQRKRLDIEDADLEDLGVAADDMGHERVELEECLASLPDSHREPLMLQVLGGFSGKEISQMMGISEQNVMTRLSRARQSLRRLMDPKSINEAEGLRKWNA